MKVNGVDFQFNRMLKIVFYKPSGGEYTVEYNPLKHEALCVRMEANIIDLPSADSENKPGYTAQIKIYNPGKELLSLIAENATWLFTPEQWAWLKTAGDKKKVKEAEKSLQDYYNSRLRLSVFAGYWDEVNKDTGYKELFQGYLNESSLHHKGTDDILTLGAHDINVNRMDISTIMETANDLRLGVNETTWINDDENRVKGEKTWDNTFKNFIRMYEDEMVVNEKPVSIPPMFNRNYNNWFRVLYVKSRPDYLAMKQGKKTQTEIINDELRDKLTVVGHPQGPGSMDNFYGIGRNLPQILDDLCSYNGLNLGWARYLMEENTLTYIVFPLEGGTSYVPAKDAEIKIYNYQNLLEAPSVDGAGRMSIKMLLNPSCKCWLRIALVLAQEYGKAHGVADIKTFETSIRDSYNNVVGSLKSTASMGTTVAINQLSGNMGVAAQQKELDTANASGYLFNTGFPIVRVTHKLSTHGASWQTEVSTVPMVRGINLEEQ